MPDKKKKKKGESSKAFAERVNREATKSSRKSINSAIKRKKIQKKMGVYGKVK